jgi:hypothetical protein
MSWQQLVIFISSCAAIGLVITHAPCTPGNRLGCAVGLAGQPFWLWENMRADQFGMFAVGLWFFGWYAFGLLRPKRPTSTDPEYIDLTLDLHRAARRSLTRKDHA